MTKLETFDNIEVVRKNGGAKIPLEIKCGISKQFAPYVRITWQGVPCEIKFVEAVPDPVLFIHEIWVKKHRLQLQDMVGAKIDGRKIPNLNIALVSKDEYEKIITAFAIKVSEYKSKYMELAAAQPIQYYAYNFLNWGECTTDMERSIQVWRDPMPDFEEETAQLIISLPFWNDKIEDREKEWTAMLEKYPAMNYDTTLHPIPQEVAQEWIDFHKECEIRRDKIRNEAAQASKAAQEAVDRKNAADRKNSEENELMIFASHEIYSSAGAKMLHSIGCRVGTKIEVYTTGYAYNMKSQGKVHTTTFDAKLELKQAGFNWDANTKMWVADYTPERWTATLPILKKYDSKYWPSDLNMGQCWECGTFHPNSKLRSDGGLPYCGC